MKFRYFNFKSICLRNSLMYFLCSLFRYFVFFQFIIRKNIHFFSKNCKKSVSFSGAYHVNLRQCWYSKLQCSAHLFGAISITLVRQNCQFGAVLSRPIHQSSHQSLSTALQSQSFLPLFTSPKKTTRNIKFSTNNSAQLKIK